MSKSMRIRVAMVLVMLSVTLVAQPALAQDAVDPPTPAAWVGIVEKTVMVIIQLAVPALVAFAIAEFKQWREARREEAWFVRLEVIVAAAVRAAEQLGLTGELREFAQNKLQYAFQYVEEQLALWGVPIDIDQYVDAIRGMIEAEVRRQFPHSETPAEA